MRVAKVLRHLLQWLSSITCLTKALAFPYPEKRCTSNNDSHNPIYYIVTGGKTIALFAAISGLNLPHCNISSFVPSSRHNGVLQNGSILPDECGKYFQVHRAWCLACFRRHQPIYEAFSCSLPALCSLPLQIVWYPNGTGAKFPGNCSRQHERLWRDGLVVLSLFSIVSEPVLRSFKTFGRSLYFAILVLHLHVWVMQWGHLTLKTTRFGLYVSKPREACVSTKVRRFLLIGKSGSTI